MFQITSIFGGEGHKVHKVFVIALLLSISITVCAEEAPQNRFITLGTAGGPVASAERSQPANALVVNENLYLVDAGDGVAGQLSKAGFLLQDVDGLFISHNHFDHTGGVLAVLGLRAQVNTTNTLEVYGPPGTRTFIDGLLKSMDPAMKAAYGMPGPPWQANIEVIELSHGATVELEGLAVMVAENSHFLIPEDSDLPEKAKSLSFRFDLENRSIVYTGDTGPSEAVVELAKDADLLVIEMMDIDAVLADVRNVFPNMPQHQFDGLEWHLRAHHLLPQQVAEIAVNAGVSQVVVTHMAPSITDDEMAGHYKDEITRTFDGQIVIANDLDSF